MVPHRGHAWREEPCPHIHSLSERPRNANQLADHLDLDYNTTRYHLDMLTDHAVLETGGDDYGKMYFLTDQFEHHREAFERITGNVGR